MNGEEPSATLPGLRLTFSSEYHEPALEGAKDTTVRYGLERAPDPGDRLALLTEDREPFAIATVTAVVKCPIRRVPVALEAIKASYPDVSAEELIENLTPYYDDPLGLDTIVTVIRWGHLEEVSP